MSDRVVNWFQATTPLLGQEMEIRLGHNVSCHDYYRTELLPAE